MGCSVAADPQAVGSGGSSRGGGGGSSSGSRSCGGDSTSNSSSSSQLLLVRVGAQERGGYILTADDKAKLQGTLWVDGHLNPKIVAQSADFIAKEAGFAIPEGRHELRRSGQEQRERSRPLAVRRHRLLHHHHIPTLHPPPWHPPQAPSSSSCPRLVSGQPTPSRARR